MSFSLIAQSLLKNKDIDPDSKLTEKSDILSALTEAGFSPKEIFREMRNIFDTTEDDATKKQMLEMAVKVHGLYSNTEEHKELPKIIFNIVGDKDKLNKMLCPPASPNIIEITQ